MLDLTLKMAHLTGLLKILGELTGEMKAMFGLKKKLRKLMAFAESTLNLYTQQFDKKIQ